jgi:hypothetical protein
MFRVEADPAKKLLIMTFTQRVVPEELAKANAQLPALLDQLPTGFRLLSDLSGLESMDPASLTQIKSSMDVLNQRGVSMVVRVIPDPSKDIGLNILSLFHYHRGIRIVTCATMVEATAALAD